MIKNCKKNLLAIILLIVALLGALVMKFVGINSKDMVQMGEENKMDEKMNVSRGDVQDKQDIHTNLESDSLEQEDEMEENDKKGYQDKFVDLEVIYLGYGMSSANWPLQKKIYEDGVEGEIAGHHIFSSEIEFEMLVSDWDIHDLSFDLTINPDNYYLMIYGRKLDWMQYNPGRMSQFGGVEYRIGVDWESNVEEGTFFFYEIDGEQIERGYLPEEVTLEF
ncbi:MAG: hypothetical protein J1F42_14060 [Lachnospiraceae bacterium]|nr:hypothetical protein [Lachnospiraceae bacterium]